MKKTFLVTMPSIIFVVFFWTTFIAFAQTQNIDLYFDHTYDYTFIRNDPPREVSPIIVIDNSGTSIKASYGIRFIIPDTLYALWDKDVISVGASGTAIENGKMDSGLTPVYSDSLKEVFLPVKTDFSLNERVDIEGLKMKIYRTANDKRYIGLDVDGDHIKDKDNFRSIVISSTEIRTDVTPPYAPYNVQGVYTDSGVLLTWNDPKDLDLERIFVDRKVTRGGQIQNDIFELYPGDERYNDEDVFDDDDELTYTIKARDSSNFSPLAEVIVSTVKTPLEQDAEEDIVPALDAEGTGGDNDIPEDSQSDSPMPLLTGLTDLDIANFSSRFPDVPSDHWAIRAMAYLTIKEPVFSGYGDGTLKIDNPVTRAEIAKIAWHAFINKYAPVVADFVTPFTDVLSSHWFTPYIKIMREREIISGYSDSTFKPMNQVTRAEAIALLLKASEINVFDYPQINLPFTDINKDAWYIPYISFAVDKEFMKGFENNRFGPMETATRGQIAVMVMKIKDYLQKIRN